MPKSQTQFTYQKIFPQPQQQDNTTYQNITQQFVKQITINNKTYLQIEPQAFQLIAQQAFQKIAFFQRKNHLQQIAQILQDPDASENDKFVAQTLLQNATVAAKQILPTCQDTGTATIIAYKGNTILTDGNEQQNLSQGIYNTYQQQNLRYSQIVPLDMYTEQNSKTNLPAQIDIYATKSNQYHFLFVAKGAGSSNKTTLIQGSKALLNPKTLEKFLLEHIQKIGVAACPPYHLVIVIGGTSPEMNLKTVKLASTKYLDNLPTTGNKHGRAFRDTQMEQTLLKATRKLPLGAQFGGTNFALDLRIIRLPRHAGSCPIGIGVSCSADRNIKGKITHEGIFLETLETNPQTHLPKKQSNQKQPIQINLEQGIEATITQLNKYPVGTKLLLSGTLIVARDLAHAQIQEQLETTNTIPQYFKKHPIYYAGPAKTPANMPSGSFGPTTAQRMDCYVAPFMKNNASRIILAKGNRSPQVTSACKKYNGFYLGTIGGAAALVAEQNITSSRIIDLPELGMEAVREIKVKDLPAFIITDNKGNTLY